MSGGSLNYICYTLSEHIGCFEDEKLDDLLQDIANLLHDREWFLSSDTCEGAWNLSKLTFMKKWFGVEPNITYCHECKFFKTEKENYGKCFFEKFCLTHKYETACEKFKVTE